MHLGKNGRDRVVGIDFLSLFFFCFITVTECIKEHGKLYQTRLKSKVCNKPPPPLLPLEVHGIYFFSYRRRGYLFITWWVKVPQAALSRP